MSPQTSRSSHEAVAGRIVSTVPAIRAIIRIEMDVMERLKIIIEKHSDVYVAYPVGINAVIVRQGETYEQALADVQSAIRFHIESFGRDSLTVDEPVIEAFVAEASV